MPNEELLQARTVKLEVSPKEIISRHGGRVICEDCGEDIINERQVIRDGHALCRACAGDVYYSDGELGRHATAAKALPVAKETRR